MILFNYSRSFRIATLLLLLMAFIFSPLATKAQSGEAVSSEEQCFVSLKESLSEAGIFETPLSLLGERLYTDIAPLFGEKKKMLSSFDLTVDQPILGIRLYSFGEQTGYTHPPKSVLPISTKSDTWGDPVKEYVLAEEYVTDAEGKEHFLNCVFLHIESDTPMDVTQDKYAYDGAAVSVLKTAPDGSYKAWYNQAPGFDFEDKHFVTWKRMIVYPMSTQNTYFNRFDVMDTYPANKLESFDVLEFFLGKEVSFKPVENSFSEAVYTTTDVATQETIEEKLPEVLLPPPVYGVNSSYRTASYYQAIEAQFPEFAGLLSIRGAIKYNTYKELITKTSMSEDEKNFATLVFGSTKELDSYYYDENKQTNPEVDKLIELLQDGDSTMEKLAAGETLAMLTAPAVEAVPLPVEHNTSSQKILLIIIILLSVLGIIGILYILRRRYALSHTTTI